MPCRWSERHSRCGIFPPIMGWITTAMGWPYVFYFMGLLGILVSLIWLKVVYSPDRHPRIGAAELDYMERGGALGNMDQTREKMALTQTDDQSAAVKCANL